MKAASVKDIKLELIYQSKEELIELCLLMSKHKKENKELLTYLLFERQNEEDYIKEISYYRATKGARKVLRNCKKYIRYSTKKETEVEVLIYFCGKIKRITEYFEYNSSMLSIYEKQLEIARKKIAMLHEDHQYDFNLMIEEELGEGF